MGIHANWKVLLKENYAHCFLSQIEDLDEQLDVLIIDFLPFIFGKSKNIKTGEHFLNYVFKVPSSFGCLPLLHRASLTLATDTRSDHQRFLRQGRTHLRHCDRHAQVRSARKRYPHHEHKDERACRSLASV